MIKVTLIEPTKVIQFRGYVVAFIFSKKHIKIDLYFVFSTQGKKNHFLSEQFLLFEIPLQQAATPLLLHKLTLLYLVIP